MDCKYCNKLCKNLNSLKQHEVRCKSNPNRIVIKPSYGMLGKKGGNQFTTGRQSKMKPETIEKIRISNTGKRWDDEKKRAHSESMKLAVINHPEAYSKNNVCGRVKRTDYNGVMLKGSWEVNVAKWLDKHGLMWETEVNPQTYHWNNSTHLYFPDFYISKLDTYIEVKGYKTERDEAKWSQFVGRLIVVDKHSIRDLDSYLGRTHKLVSAPCS
jgi:hypothetical protein